MEAESVRVSLPQRDSPENDSLRRAFKQMPLPESQRPVTTE